MRLFWSGFLMTGLLLVGLSVYEGLLVTDEPSLPGPAEVSASEDGTVTPNRTRRRSCDPTRALEPGAPGLAGAPPPRQRCRRPGAPADTPPSPWGPS
jgi:hypothetical protein